MIKIAALLRVSTGDQDTDNQRHAIEQAYPGADIKWFVEQGVSGKTPTSQRPVFQACIRYARKQKATLVVANLSRLGRDLAEVATFYRDYVEAGRIDLHAMDYPNLEKDTAGIAQVTDTLFTRRIKTEQVQIQGDKMDWSAEIRTITRKSSGATTDQTVIGKGEIQKVN